MGGSRKKYSLERRRKIGEGVSKRYQRLLEEGHPLPDRKRCSKCRETRPAGDFGIVRRKLKSGLVSETLASWCKPCNARHQRERLKRLKAEGIDVTALKTASDQRWRESLSPAKREALRKRMREAQTAQRRKKGHAAYPSRQGAQESHEGDRLSPSPLVSLLKAEFAADGKGIGVLAERSGIAQRRIYGLLHGEYERVALSTVDRLLHGLGLPHMLPIIYPET